MNNKYKRFLKDIFFFIISTFIPKAISFLLVPLYTNCLSTVEYGVADIVTITVSLLVPILTLDINDAVLRFTIENKKEVMPLKLAFLNVTKGIIFVWIIVLINDVLGFLPVDRLVALLFILNYVGVSIYGICIAYLRAIEKVKLLSIASILLTTVTVVSNLVLLLVIKAGLTGYLVSGFIGYAVVDILILCKINIVKIFHDAGPIDRSLYKEMISYSIPLIAANISWWINSSSDRYLVTAMMGVDENGIYSIAYKIPTILQMLQSVFSQAWLLSAFREYKSDDGSKYVGKVFEFYSVAMTLSCAFLIILDIPLARFLYAHNFFDAWRYVPFLLISVVFIANCGFFESLLTLQKKSKIVAKTAAYGAVVNTILNIVLIYLLGTIGAAIATMVGYLVMWIMRVKPVMVDYRFKIKSLKLVVLYMLLVFEALVMIALQSYSLCFVSVAIMVLINWKTLKTMIMQLFSIISHNNKYRI